MVVAPPSILVQELPAKAFRRKSASMCVGAEKDVDFLPKDSQEVPAEGLKEIFVISVILCIASFGYAGSANIYNVLDSGAVGNGISDDSQALLKAWATACGNGGPNPSVLIPAGKTFLLNPVAFNGPCKSTSIRFQVLGNLIAPNTIEGWGGASKWLSFHGVNGLKIDGSGRIGGQGAVWWDQSCKRYPEKKCTLAPTALLLDACNNLHVTGITLFNNPRNHISINSCNNVYISSVTITAPADSPNTDGIDIEHSQYVNIWQSTIGTGDDCIAIGNGGKNVNISWVTCGPGHGISIGSLGKDDEFAEVEQVQVMHCTFTGTLTGARIKTWQGGSGYARGILFDDMHIKNVENPIIIDQYYCNGDHNCNNQTSAVDISNAKFVGFHGTSSREVAIKLECSKTVGCTDIVLDNVQLQPADPGMKLSSYCINAHGPPCTSCVPQVPCLH